ncbi:MFS transporter [Ornithinimicrobium faecis]|uniref:MFS transporter n=1 Tax=Ornithinimicrobium faecis TaxID=2934158 RepID=A0ABY4YYV2_9MICO|nr:MULTISPECIES: MFS transporter [unclassified Ornithinimicrobium]USQ81709.1 MFS transporter [Ornithinimicrobium sp. HY1793]
MTAPPQSASESETSLTRPERLDRLPFTRKHGRLLTGSGIGWALDAMDVGLISFVMAALAAQWQLTQTEQSWLGSIGFVGMALGASLGGLLADKIGRRSVFALTLLVYGLATGASALAGGLAVLLVLRFIVGLGLGAELPVASTLVSEFAPSRIRGRMVVILEAFWAVGWLLAALTAYFIIPLSDDGWRWAFALGLVPAAYAIVIRRGLPESVRFLEAKGRDAEAERVVREFEASAGVPSPPEPAGGGSSTEAAAVGSPQQTAVETSSATSSAPGLADLFGSAMRRRTAALWLTWFGVNFAYYGAFIWIPSLLHDGGFTLVKSFQFTLIITIAQLPGYALAAVLIEVWGRRATLATFLAGSAISAVLFGQAESDTMILVTGCALSMFNLGAWGALYAVTPEVYPTQIRATGAGWAAAFGRIASIIAPLSVPVLYSAGGLALVFAVLGAAFVLAMVAALFLPEMAGEELLE